MEIKKSRRGWIVENDGISPFYGCLVQGSWAGWKHLVKFDENFPENLDLEEQWNEWRTNREALVERAAGSPDKVIKRGHYVE